MRDPEHNCHRWQVMGCFWRGQQKKLWPWFTLDGEPSDRKALADLWYFVAEDREPGVFCAPPRMTLVPAVARLEACAQAYRSVYGYPRVRFPLHCFTVLAIHEFLHFFKYKNGDNMVEKQEALTTRLGKEIQPFPLYGSTNARKGERDGST